MKERGERKRLAVAVLESALGVHADGMICDSANEPDLTAAGAAQLVVCAKLQIIVNRFPSGR